MIPLATAHNITHDKLATLVPSFRARVAAWLDACHAAGLQPYIYEGLRTSKRQTELYAIGRTKKGSKVTHAKAGQSMHQYGLAIDFVPLKPAKAKDLWEADWSARPMRPITGWPSNMAFVA